MANSYLTANMSLVVPVPGIDPGPDWANNLNASLTILDSHTHAPGSGVQITPSAININADLPFNSNNATLLRSVRLFPNTALLSGAADLGCLYESGVDLYYNDGSGNQVRITQSGSVSGSAGTITGLPSGTASASYQSGSGTFQFLQATSTAANLDVATVIIRYPGSYPTPSGNYIALQAPSSLASGYSFTLPSLPSSNTTFLTVSTAGVMALSYTLDNSTLGISGSSIIVKNSGITTAQIADGAVTPAKRAALGQIISSGNSGSFSTGSTSYQFVTNLACTITTQGRPVFIGLYGTAGQPAASYIGTGATGTAVINLYRDDIAAFSECLLGSDNANGVQMPPSALWAIDTPSAGTYVYRCQIKCVTAASAVVSYSYLIAYQL